MAEPITIYRMTVLAMLEKADFPLSNMQICNFFLEQDYTDFFTVQQAVNDLSNSGLVEVETTPGNARYRITPQGRNTLRLLRDKVNPAIEKDILRYFETNKIKFQEQRMILANYDKCTPSGFVVRCQLKDEDTDMLDLTLHVRTKEQAEAICKNWAGQHMEVYAFLMDTLIC